MHNKEYQIYQNSAQSRKIHLFKLRSHLYNLGWFEKFEKITDNIVVVTVNIYSNFLIAFVQKRITHTHITYTCIHKM